MSNDVKVNCSNKWPCRESCLEICQRCRAFKGPGLRMQYGIPKFYIFRGGGDHRSCRRLILPPATSPLAPRLPGPIASVYRCLHCMDGNNSDPFLSMSILISQQGGEWIKESFPAADTDKTRLSCLVRVSGVNKLLHDYLARYPLRSTASRCKLRES